MFEGVQEGRTHGTRGGAFGVHEAVDDQAPLRQHEEIGEPRRCALTRHAVDFVELVVGRDCVALG